MTFRVSGCVFRSAFLVVCLGLATSVSLYAGGSAAANRNGMDRTTSDTTLAHDEYNEKALEALRKTQAAQKRQQLEFGLSGIFGFGGQTGGGLFLNFATERNLEKSAWMVSITTQFISLPANPQPNEITIVGPGVLYRRYLNAKVSTLYIGAGAYGVLGVENNANVTEQNSVLSGGILLRQNIGFRIANRTNIEFGVYEQHLFSSGLLPDNYGLFLNASFVL